MIEAIKANLNELRALLTQLSQEELTESYEELSKATIGQHIRHIIELFQCLQNDYNQSEICYDNRKRSILIETNPVIAIQAIDLIVDSLHLNDKTLIVNYSFNTQENQQINSSYHRELLYNLEHSIHHQAIIKVVLLKLSHITISDHFGVAPSTITHRSSINS